VSPFEPTLVAASCVGGVAVADEPGTQHTPAPPARLSPARGEHAEPVQIAERLAKPSWLRRRRQYVLLGAIAGVAVVATIAVGGRDWLGSAEPPNKPSPLAMQTSVLACPILEAAGVAATAVASEMPPSRRARAPQQSSRRSS
jgi:hypothetical protein